MLLLTLLGLSAGLFIRACLEPVPLRPVMVWRLRHLLALPAYTLQSVHYGAYLLLGAGLFTFPAMAAVLYAAERGWTSPRNRARLAALAVWAQVQVQWTLGCAQYLDAGPAWSGGWVGSGLAHALAAPLGQVAAGLVVLLGDTVVAAWWLGLPPRRLGALLLKGWTAWTVLMESFWEACWNLACAVPRWSLWPRLQREARAYVGALRRDLPQGESPVTSPSRSASAPLSVSRSSSNLESVTHPAPGLPAQAILEENLARSRFLRGMLEKHGIEDELLRRALIEGFPLHGSLSEEAFLRALASLQEEGRRPSA